jgi:tetratricopeptide (TPR) repeat protein
MSLVPMSIRVDNSIVSYVRYIWKLLWPANLSAFYPHPVSAPGHPLPLDDVIASAIILLGVTALAAIFHRARYFAVGWFSFLITLLPVIGIVQVGWQAMADRYAYIPCIGLLVALVWGIADVVGNMQLVRVVLSFAALCIITAFSAATIHYLGYWQNSVTLFSQARVTLGRPDSYLEMLYANALYRAGRSDEALQHYEESCSLGLFDECHYGIAQILFDRHQFREAVGEYQFALRITPRRQMKLACLNRSAEALVQLGFYGDAQSSLADALSIDPADAIALRLREQISARKGGGN